MGWLLSARVSDDGPSLCQICRKVRIRGRADKPHLLRNVYMLMGRKEPSKSLIQQTATKVEPRDAPDGQQADNDLRCQPDGGAGWFPPRRFRFWQTRRYFRPQISSGQCGHPEQNRHEKNPQPSGFATVFPRTPEPQPDTQATGSQAPTIGKAGGFGEGLSKQLPATFESLFVTR